jgi:sterol desaturase/sphingolipid hydroxylase (fatty acid hydroxylase superfamily)
MDILNVLLNIDPNYIVIGMIALFYSMEHLFAGRSKYSKRGRHLIHNVLFQVTFVLCNIFWAAFTVFCIEWLNNHRVGLFFMLEIPVWIKLILGVVILDFVTYWFHRGAHRIPLVWRFHRIHHSDTTMDASTTFRSHPLELIFWFGLTGIAASAIFGLEPIALGLYFLISTPFFFLEHSNLRFPTWLDKTVGLVLTTPNLHRIHHEQDQRYTDSNYADIFIIWDRLFGTFKYKPVNEINIGLKEFEKEEQQGFWYLFKSPFYSIKRIHSDELPIPGTSTPAKVAT